MTDSHGYFDRFLRIFKFSSWKDELGGRRRTEEPDEVMEVPNYARIGNTEDLNFPKTQQFGKPLNTQSLHKRYTTSATTALVSKHFLQPIKDDRRSIWADVQPSSSTFAQEQYERKFTNQPLYLDRNVDIEISDDEDGIFVPDTRRNKYGHLERHATNGETRGEMLKSPTALQRPIPALIPRSSVPTSKMRPIERKYRFSSHFEKPSQNNMSRSSIMSGLSQKFRMPPMKKPSGISKENRLSRSARMLQSVMRESYNYIQKDAYKKLLEDLTIQAPVPKHRSLLGGSQQPKQKIVETINLADLEFSDDEVQITSMKSPTKTSTVLQESINNSRKKTPIVAPINANKSITLSSSESTSRVSTPDIERVNSMLIKVNSTPCCQTEWLSKNTDVRSKQREERQKIIQEQEKLIKKYEAERKKSEADLYIRKMRDISISSPPIVIDDSEEEEEFVLPELTPQQLSLVRNVTQRGSPSEVIISKFNLNITRNDLRTLVGDTWLNDEVINFYMNLLTERSTKAENMPKVYAMNTFFAVRLLQDGHSGVKRWTRKVDIFSQDIIPVPVHVSNVHWCMAIIHMRKRTIRYYDSMGQSNMAILNALEQYLKCESQDKKQRPFDMSGWEKECMADAPRQMNGSDCGVFSCMFAEYITRGSEITFSQGDMPYFRQKMILEIATGQLLL